MAPDERDRSFDKALARHLRSMAPAGQAAEMPREFASQGGACPDPETLAAYHERSLLPEQLNSLKEHLVACANCQIVLAHLETTDEIPLQAAEEDQVFAQTASAPVISASSQTHTRVEKALPLKSRRARLLKGARWQWLAPAGALAAGLLVWIALHENQPLPRPALPGNENKVAQNREPAAPLPSVSTGVPQSSAPPKTATALARPKLPVPQSADANGRSVSEAAKQSGMGSGAGVGKSLDDKELHARKDDKRETATDLQAAVNQRDLHAKNLPQTSRQEVQVQSQVVIVEPQIAQSQNTLAQNQNNTALQKAAGPSPLNQAEAPKMRKATAAPPPAPAPPPAQPGVAGGIASSYNDSASLEVAGAIINPRLISPPGSRLIWRVGRSGLIEFSRDGGSSWSRQTSGVLTDLLTGSAPSDQVCWSVGSAGTILLTTDGGAHWKVVSSPLAEDLGRVRASDALHATIWNAGNTKGFETNDGGLTWKPVAHP
jgi:hypothetical protein